VRRSLDAPSTHPAAHRALSSRAPRLKVLNMSGNEIEDKDLRKKCRSRK
jgi:hypothetical protein